MLSADAVQRGRSLFAGREGDEVADPALALADDGTDPDGPASAPFDGEGSPHPAHAADRGRPAARPSCSTRAPPAGPGAPPPATRSRGSYRTPPSVGHDQPGRRAGRRDARRSWSREAGDGLYVTDVAGLHSGVNPVSGHLLGGRHRPADRGRRAGRAGARDHDRQRPRLDAARRCAASGSEARWVPFGGSVKAPPLLIGEMAVSGS